MDIPDPESLLMIGPRLKPLEVKRHNIILIQTMASEQPMPTDPSEVDTKFAEVVEELDLPPAQRQQMFALPLEKKWQLYCSRKKVQFMADHLSM